MNKNFGEEPDSTAPPRCPGGGAVGITAAAENRAARVASTEQSAEPASCCDAGTCPAADEVWPRAGRVPRYFVRRGQELGG